MNYSTIKKIAINYSIDPSILEAVLQVEASGEGFFKDWNGLKRIKIQFEPHIFVRYLNKKGVQARLQRLEDGGYSVFVNGKLILKNKVDRQYKEWEAFNVASKIDSEVAMMATSWGLGQIMGFNHKLAGYDTVKEMVDCFKEDEEYQFLGMIEFIKSCNLLYKLKNLDWEGFARGYNGKHYAKYKYHTRLNNAYNKIKSRS